MDSKANFGQCGTDITEELKIFESEILQAGERIQTLEQQLYAELIAKLQGDLEILKHNAEAIAQWDVLSCFANSAKKYNYCCPEWTTATTLTIQGARHPVIEHATTGPLTFPTTSQLIKILSKY